VTAWELIFLDPNEGQMKKMQPEKPLVQAEFDKDLGEI